MTLLHIGEIRSRGTDKPVVRSDKVALMKLGCRGMLDGQIQLRRDHVLSSLLFLRNDTEYYSSVAQKYACSDNPQAYTLAIPFSGTILLLQFRHAGVTIRRRHSIFLSSRDKALWQTQGNLLDTYRGSNASRLESHYLPIASHRSAAMKSYDRAGRRLRISLHPGRIGSFAKSGHI